MPAAEFAYNSAVSEDMGMSPFEIDLGCNPKSPLDLLAGPEDKNEIVEKFKVNLKTSLEDALYAYKISKAGQTARSSIKDKPHVYNVGDKIWIKKRLFTDDYAKSQVSDKLSSKEIWTICSHKIDWQERSRVGIARSS